MDLNETRERIIYEKRGPIARITLNWPEKANAQDQKLVEEVDAALRGCGPRLRHQGPGPQGQRQGLLLGTRNRQQRGRLSGSSSRAIKHMGTPWKPQTDLFVKPTLNLWEFSKPTIAQVHGYCVGGGTHYGLTTDIVIASEDAYFQYPPLQGFGMPSGECSIEPWVFMNWRRAAYYLYMSEIIDAKKALEVGLVNEVVPREELDARVEAIARHIAQAPLTTLLGDQGEPQAGLGADGDAVALAELQRSRGARDGERRRAGFDWPGAARTRSSLSEMARRQAAAAANSDGKPAT